MKAILNHILTAALLMSVFSACKQSNVNPVQSASLTIINAIAEKDTLITNFNSNKPLQYYATAGKILPAAYTNFSGYIGNIPLAISRSSDTTHSMYKQTLTLTANSIHTLFLMGTNAAPDSLFTNDNVQSTTDSVVKVRFVNLSTGSNPISINLKGSPQTPVVSSLAYKSITDFQPFTAKNNNPSSGTYVFEIRDAASQTLLATYTMNQLLSVVVVNATNIAKLFKSFTIAFKGLPGGTGASAQGAILINNY